MAKSFTFRSPDDEASDVQALARAQGLSLNETVRLALAEAVAARRADLEFKSRIRRTIDEDRELLQRTGKVTVLSGAALVDHQWCSWRHRT